ncbi:unnamed protein product [Rotaria magnacalcarata]|uniref:Uncharacterized protein n=1 Tax=Rotaria magnacalcarata TaxID=392030 RepID=A0A8S3HHW4_9BILA|nr:unnamed protein product [Rotaria magnacalcarata]
MLFSLSIVNSYGLNGMGIEAVKRFDQMPRELINDLTYICVLNACSHSGLVDVARSIFNNIQPKTDMIYTTMVLEIFPFFAPQTYVNFVSLFI